MTIIKDNNKDVKDIRKEYNDKFCEMMSRYWDAACLREEN